MRGVDRLCLVTVVVLWIVAVPASTAEPPRGDQPAEAREDDRRGGARGAPAAPAAPLPPGRTFAPSPPAAPRSDTPPGGLGRPGGNGPSVRLQGDPDSVFTLGGPSRSGQLRLLAAVEVNDVVLKAIAPDPRVSSADTRTRAAGAWVPLDATGRPYQFRLGARLVW